MRHELLDWLCTEFGVESLAQKLEEGCEGCDYWVVVYT